MTAIKEAIESLLFLLVLFVATLLGIAGSMALIVLLLPISPVLLLLPFVHRLFFAQEQPQETSESRPEEQHASPAAVCPAAGGPHEIDTTGMGIARQDGNVRIRVYCQHCDLRGFIGESVQLDQLVTWDA